MYLYVYKCISHICILYVFFFLLARLQGVDPEHMAATHALMRTDVFPPKEIIGLFPPKDGFPPKEIVGLFPSKAVLPPEAIVGLFPPKAESNKEDASSMGTTDTENTVVPQCNIPATNNLGVAGIGVLAPNEAERFPASITLEMAGIRGGTTLRLHARLTTLKQADTTFKQGASTLKHGAATFRPGTGPLNTPPGLGINGRETGKDNWRKTTRERERDVFPLRHALFCAETKQPIPEGASSSSESGSDSDSESDSEGGDRYSRRGRGYDLPPRNGGVGVGLPLPPLARDRKKAEARPRERKLWVGGVGGVPTLVLFSSPPVKPRNIPPPAGNNPTSASRNSRALAPRNSPAVASANSRLAPFSPIKGWLCGRRETVGSPFRAVGVALVICGSTSEEVRFIYVCIHTYLYKCMCAFIYIYIYVYI